MENRQDVTGVMANAIVWDNHACMPLRPDDSSFLHQLQRHHQAGTTLVSLNVGFDAHLDDPLAPFGMLARFRTWVSENSDKYLLIDNTDDILKAKREGKLGICFDLEGGAALAENPNLIRAYYDLGVRWMLIAYNNLNNLGGGCQQDDPGLTDFGRAVIDEMESAGMVLCCSHTGHKTVREAIEYSNNPVIFSHSNPYGCHPHQRNIPDELIIACANSGGVINLNGVGYFLGNNDISVKNFVRHVNYVAELVGVEHVGMGLDYCFDTSEVDELMSNNPGFFPEGMGYDVPLRMLPPEQIPDIVAELLQCGWRDDEIKGFLGGNNLRVAKRVWR